MRRTEHVARALSRVGVGIIEPAGPVRLLVVAGAATLLDELVADRRARTRRGEAPALPPEQRLVHVHRGVGDAGSLVRGGALEVAERLGDRDGRVALHLEHGAPPVQRGPALGRLVPHLDAESAGHLLGDERREAAHPGAEVDRRAERGLPRHPLLRVDRAAAGGRP